MFPLHCFRKWYIRNMVKKRSELFLVLSVKFKAILLWNLIYGPSRESSRLLTRRFLKDFPLKPRPLQLRYDFACGNNRPLTMLSIPSKEAESLLCNTIDAAPEWGTALQPVGLQKRCIIKVPSTVPYRNLESSNWSKKVIFIDFRKAIDAVLSNST